MEDFLNLWGNLLIGSAVILVPILVVDYIRKHRKPTRGDSPMLLAFYTDISVRSDTQMMHVAHGEIDQDISYDVMLVSNGGGTDDPVIDVPPTAIYRVQLPFTSRVHLLAMSTTEMAQLNPGGRNSLMERVVLEGDFPGNFSLFALKGQGTQARYVLDPAAMSYVMDACYRMSWELIDDELYFVAHTTQITDEMIAGFVREIRPAVEIPAGQEQSRTLPQYRNMRPNDLQCPICDERMTKKPHWYECAQGHGRLISGEFLIAISKGEMSLPPPEHPVQRAHGVLQCPFCQHTMEQVEYQGRVPIDSCTHCSYRWLDASELTKVIM